MSEMASGVLVRDGAGVTLSAVRRRARACVLARRHGRKDKGCLASRPLAPCWPAVGTPIPRRGSVAGMLLAEDLLLLVTDDTSGRLSAPAAQVDAGLGGANLVELTLLNKVDLSGEGDQGKPGRIIVRDPSPAGDEVLDAALGILITRQGSKPSTVIRPLSKNLRQRLYQRLAGSGMIRAGRGRTLGIFPARTWPAHDARHEEQVRQLVTQALVQQMAPDARTAALIALLHALRCEHKIIDPRPYQLSRRQLRARAEEVAMDNWASQAVRKVISEMAAATATAAATVASSG
jgi:Golgi phosphoprotein 3 (GPP34)